MLITNILMVEKVASGIELAKEFYDLALDEFATGDWKKQKDACEKGFRAATEALDTLLSMKGYQIEAGLPIAHVQRTEALMDLIEINSTFAKIDNDYSIFKDKLHGMCFYSNSNPSLYKSNLMKVKNFIDLIVEMI